MNKGHKKAFTLIELLIASSILMMIIAMSMRVFFNVTRLNTYIELTDQLQFETRYALERIVREIQASTIDYPEYYNYYVLNGSGLEFNLTDNLGSNYSVYGSRFFNPGEQAGLAGVQGVNKPDFVPKGIGTNDLGTWCEYGSLSFAVITSESCSDKPSLEATEDFVTGTNPYTSEVFTLPSQASAICDSTNEMFPWSKRDCSFTSSTEAHEVGVLFLISPDGSKKTIISTEDWNKSSRETGTVISMLRMDGEDTNNDGVRNSWVCADDFLCQNVNENSPFISSGILQDINMSGVFMDLYKDFIPISPPFLNITDLRFYIAPIEDPVKAYDEFPQQIQPYVTIVLTAEILDPRVSQLPASQRSITLQTTVSTQFYGEIDSYIGTK